MGRNISGLKRGGPGRPKGIPNKATIEIREACRKLLESPAYATALEARLIEGRAGQVEPLLYYYAYGKPKERIELEGAAPMPLVIELVTKRSQLVEADADAGGEPDDE